VSFRTNAEDGVFLMGVGPFAFGAAPLPPALNVSAVDCADFAWSAFSEAPSIILRIFGSEACSSAFAFLIFFLRSTAVDAALAIFAASAGGSSRTCSYSLRIRDATLIWSARSRDAVDGGFIEKTGLGECSRAIGDAKSAANISLVRFAEVRTRCSAELEVVEDAMAGWISVMLGGCVDGLLVEVVGETC